MAMTRIKILSDLHLETPAAYDVFAVTAGAPYLALLGDIGYVKDKGLMAFLEQQLSNFKIVFFLLGNHEPYYSDWAEAKQKLKEFADDVRKRRQAGASLGEFVLLDQTRYDISSDVTILGCTLFSHILPSQSDRVSFGLNDFYHIKDWTVEDHEKAYISDLEWLNAQVASISNAEPHRKLVIFTHHSPTTDERAVDPAHARSPISSGFSTDLSLESCWTNPNVKIWAFGHTHFNCDFKDDKTGKRVLTNQKGYYFAQATGFDEKMVVEL